MKEIGGAFRIKWEIIKQVRDYNPATKHGALCLAEKLSILDHEGHNLLNKRSEIISKCRHRNKHMLGYKTSNVILQDEDNIT